MKLELNKRQAETIRRLLLFASDGWYNNETFDSDLFPNHFDQEAECIIIFDKITEASLKEEILINKILNK